MKRPDFHDELLFWLTYSQKMYMINGGFTPLIKFNQRNKAVNMRCCLHLFNNLFPHGKRKPHWNLPFKRQKFPTHLAIELLVRVRNALQLERENWTFWLHARSGYSFDLNISPKFFQQKFLSTASRHLNTTLRNHLENNDSSMVNLKRGSPSCEKLLLF